MSALPVLSGRQLVKVLVGLATLSIGNEVATSSFATASRPIEGWSFPITRRLRKAHFALSFGMPASLSMIFGVCFKPKRKRPRLRSIPLLVVEEFEPVRVRSARLNPRTIGCRSRACICRRNASRSTSVAVPASISARRRNSSLPPSSATSASAGASKLLRAPAPVPRAPPRGDVRASARSRANVPFPSILRISGCVDGVPTPESLTSRRAAGISRPLSPGSRGDT